MRRVLVVDDQPEVRTIISLVLRMNRFEIVEEASATSALNQFEPARFDLAIVDMFLEDSNGSDLIAALRAQAPGLPVIVVSGMAVTEFLSNTPMLSGVVCLQKPFRPADLMSAVEAAHGSYSRPNEAIAAAG